MTNIQTSEINEMLASIPDPRLRETYGAILSGKFPFKVFCMDPQTLPGEKKKAHAKGVLIGYIDKKSVVIDEPKLREDNVVISGIETSRDRFDGRKGFKCYCGNWSIQAVEEQPTLGKYSIPIPPSQEDLIEISKALQKSGKTSGIQFINGFAEYDGFRIQEVAL